MGFDVQVSEHTDFQRRPDAGTFEACFESIRESDYYLLLIGHRRGQWYDKPNRISVTRQEYRVSQEWSAESGRPIVLAFVRSDVLAVMRERDKIGARQEPSTLDDPEFTVDFIREVSREDEVEQAAADPAGHPGGRWLSPFRDFRELVTILRSTLRLATSLPHAALLESLRWECGYNLRLLLRKTRGRPFYSHHWLSRMRRSLTLRPDDLKGTVTLSYEQLQDAVVQLGTQLVQPEKFVQTVMAQAIGSGNLLAYDTAARSHVMTPLLDALYRLREELELYRVRHSGVRERADEISQIWESARRYKHGADVPAFTLMALYAVDDTLYNIERILVSILRYLYGHTDTVEVQYRPVSPIPSFAEEIERETVTEKDLHSWLLDDDILLRVGMTDTTEEQQQQWEETESLMRKILGDAKYEQVKKQVMEQMLGFEIEET
jgi:Domain of unknown function (DUF4062)